MGDSDPIPACLSAERHDPRDSTLHYLGCLEFWERQAYFNKLEPEYRKRIDGELRRIICLRRVLKSERDDSVSSLVINLESSMKYWRGSRGEHGIDAVRKWRSGKDLRNGVTQHFPQEEAYEPYDPDNDVKAYLLSYKDRKDVENAEDHGVKGQSQNHKMLEPQRKIPVSRLLMQSAAGGPSKASDRLLSDLSQAAVGSINYLHLPANNMAVSTYPFVYKWTGDTRGSFCCDCP